MDEMKMVGLARRHAKVFSGFLKDYSLLSPISIGFKRLKKNGRLGAPVLISFRTNGTVEGRCGKTKVTWPMPLDAWDRKVRSELRTIAMEKIRKDKEKEIRVSKKTKTKERGHYEETYLYRR